MRKLIASAALLAAASVLFASLAQARQPGGQEDSAAGAVKASSASAQGVVLSTPDLLVTRQGGIDTLAIKGDGYTAFKREGNEATLLVKGAGGGSGEERIPAVPGGGLSKVRWEPADGGTLYHLSFTAEPLSSVTNAIPGSEMRPDMPQVMAAFSYGETAARARLNHRGGSAEYDPNVVPGDYQMPKFPKYKYSDAMVTLKANGADFRQVLWLMSEIGNVSIMLDPYWQDEPTGSRRPPGAGVSAGDGGNGGSGNGYRSAGDFNGRGLDEGVGDLYFNFENVPFDTALDLIISSVGLVYVPIYPEE
jgi:hypothetical protein